MWILENPQQDAGIAGLGVSCLRSMPPNRFEWSGNDHFVTVVYLWLGKELDSRVQVGGSPTSSISSYKQCHHQVR